MKFAVVLVLLSLGIVGLLSAVAYLVFFHGQITRPKIEELFGISIKTKDSVLSSEQMLSNFGCVAINAVISRLAEPSMRNLGVSAGILDLF